MSIQAHYFQSKGGFVLHKVPLANGFASAWFDDAGKLLDCEYFLRGSRRTVKAQPGKPLWRKIEAAGKPYILPEYGR